MAQRRFYKVLGVGTKATPEQVKKAYRAKARKLHPDAGGDPDKFVELQAAYEVLSDPDRRRRYDETGEYDEAPRCGVPPHVRDVLYNTLLDVMYPEPDGFVFSPPKPTDPATTDVLDKMLRDMKERLAGIDKEVEKAKQKKAAAERLVGRFATDGEDNVMDGMARAMVRQWQDYTESGQKAAEAVKEAMAFLKDYRYTKDVPPFERPKRLRELEASGFKVFTFNPEE